MAEPASKLTAELRGASIRVRSIGVDDVPADVDWLCDLLDRAEAALEQAEKALRGILALSGGPKPSGIVDARINVVAREALAALGGTDERGSTGTAP